MRADPTSCSIRRVLAHVTIAALGVLTIVGSGGGAIGFPDIDYGGIGGSIPHSPYVQVFPLRPTVQAGTIVLFETTVSSATPPLSYQWRRNGVDITGATGPTYTLGGAQLGDDGTVFTVVVSAANGVTTGGVVLLVSPLPGVVFQDADFPVSNWTRDRDRAADAERADPRRVAGLRRGQSRPLPEHHLPDDARPQFAASRPLRGRRNVRPGDAGCDLHDRRRGTMQPAELLQRIDVHRADAVADVRAGRPDIPATRCGKGPARSIRATGSARRDRA